MTLEDSVVVEYQLVVAQSSHISVLVKDKMQLQGTAMLLSHTMHVLSHEKLK